MSDNLQIVSVDGGVESEVVELCLSEFDVCEQLVRMATQDGHTDSATSAAVNIPPITEGTHVQIVNQALTSQSNIQFHHLEQAETFLMSTDDPETFIEVPFMVVQEAQQQIAANNASLNLGGVVQINNGESNCIPEENRETSQNCANDVVTSDLNTLRGLIMPNFEGMSETATHPSQSESLVDDLDLIHSYSALETEKEDDSINIRFDEHCETETESIDKSMSCINSDYIDATSSFVEVNINDTHDAVIQSIVGTNVLPEMSVIKNATSISHKHGVNFRITTNFGQKDLGTMIKDAFNDPTRLPNEPVTIVQKKIPYGVLSGNTLTILQEATGENKPPLLAKIPNMHPDQQEQNIPFISKHRLKRRIITQVGQLPFVCDICSKGFHHAYNLKLHLMAHINHRPFVCSVCKKGFIQKTKLKLHMTSHSKDKIFRCNLCNKMFKYIDTLKRHRYLHLKERAFVCTICDKQFSWKGSLVAHMTKHRLDKQYICDVCGKQFHYQSSLISHVKRHGDRVGLECLICEHTFTLESALQRHMETHPKKDLHKCRLCPQEFANVTLLARHARIHDPNTNQFLCKLCMHSFSLLDDLQRHLENHPPDRKYVCNECDKAFTHLRGLNQHHKLHARIMKHMCDMCEKGFQHLGNLRMHLRTHSGEKPYRCDVCQRAFSGKSSLKRHQKVHNRGESNKEQVVVDGVDFPIYICVTDSCNAAGPRLI